MDEQLKYSYVLFYTRYAYEYGNNKVRSAFDMQIVSKCKSTNANNFQTNTILSDWMEIGLSLSVHL